MLSLSVYILGSIVNIKHMFGHGAHNGSMQLADRRMLLQPRARLSSCHASLFHWIYIFKLIFFIGQISYLIVRYCQRIELE